MSNSGENPSFETGELAEEFLLGCECALPYVTETAILSVVGRGPLPQDYPGVKFIKAVFDPIKTRTPA